MPLQKIHPGRRMLLGAAVAVLIAGCVAAVTSRSHAAESVATPATLADVLARAQSGETIRLAAGDYGRFRGASKDGMVTLAAADGADVTISPQIDGAANLRFQGLTVGATSVRNARNVQFVGNRFVGMTSVDVAAGVTDVGIVFDSNTFLSIDTCSTCAEGRLTVVGHKNTAPVGVTISNNLFGSGGESDGVQILGGAYGVQIVGNEFDHIVQGNFETHADPLQLYGSSHTRIAGNFFHDNDTGIMAPDGADHEIIENNLFVSPANGYPWPIVLGSDVGSTISHNTLVDGACEFNLRCGTLRIDGGNSGQVSRDSVVRDNVYSSIATNGGGAGFSARDHNLVAAGDRGPGDIVGRPRFVGGADSWGAFRLADGSPGRGAASDGADIGILDRPSQSTPPPTSAPMVGAPADRGSAPVARLTRPTRGAAVASRLGVSIGAEDDSGIERVEVWVDRGRRATVRRSSYHGTRALPSEVGLGLHTVVARAFARDGETASAAVTVLRHRLPGGRPARDRAWKVATRPSGTTTSLAGRGPARRRVAITLTPCGDRSGRASGRLLIRAGHDGRLSGTGRAAVCVLRLQPR